MRDRGDRVEGQWGQVGQGRGERDRVEGKGTGGTG